MGQLQRRRPQVKLAAKATQIGSFFYSVRIKATATSECWSSSTRTATYTTTISTPYQWSGITTLVGPYNYPCPAGSSLIGETIAAHAEESSGGSAGTLTIVMGSGRT